MRWQYTVLYLWYLYSILQASMTFVLKLFAANTNFLYRLPQKTSEIVKIPILTYHLTLNHLNAIRWSFWCIRDITLLFNRRYCIVSVTSTLYCTKKKDVHVYQLNNSHTVKHGICLNQPCRSVLGALQQPYSTQNTIALQ